MEPETVIPPFEFRLTTVPLLDGEMNVKVPWLGVIVSVSLPLPPPGSASEMPVPSSCSVPNSGTE
jgi:hypothetical protein